MENNAMIIEVLRKAIESEIEGQHFYMMASRTTADLQGREVFEKLAKDEIEHERFLRTNYKSMLERGVVDPSARLGSPTMFAGPSPIFSPAIRARVKDAHYEMSSLSVGMQLESNAVAFYRGAAAQAHDPSVRNFLLALANWEQGHYAALQTQQEELKVDYWTSQGFSPM